MVQVSALDKKSNLGDASTVGISILKRFAPWATDLHNYHNGILCSSLHRQMLPRHDAQISCQVVMNSMYEVYHQNPNSMYYKLFIDKKRVRELQQHSQVINWTKLFPYIRFYWRWYHTATPGTCFRLRYVLDEAIQTWNICWEKTASVWCVGFPPNLSRQQWGVL